MPQTIRESDWKLHKQLHPLALDRFCQKVLTAIESISADSTQSPHQRYLAVYALIQRRDKEIEQLFDALKRSNALFQIAAFRKHGLLEESEFMSFSEETRTMVNRFFS